jgi:tetratricopeptide (TPR) repeat protein
LEKTLDSSHIYDQNKRHTVNLLKKELSQVDPQRLQEKFDLYNRLFDQYKVFKSDSAYFYSLKTKEIATQLNDSSLISKAYLNLADIAISVGMYKEALDYLQSIHIDTVRDVDKPMYYGLYGRGYSDMAEYSGLPDLSQKYNEYARSYREKILKLTEKGSFFNSFMVAYNQFSDDELDLATKNLKSLLNKNLDLGEEALANFVLGQIYQRKNQLDLAEYHYASAAIADVKNSTKESLAIIKLSELLFKDKKLEMASSLIQKAYEDAKFYGAQQRKLQVGAILPLIEEEIVKNIEMERKRLYWQYISVVVFSILMILFSSIIFIQYKKLQKARGAISKAHAKLKETHTQLLIVNNQLKTRNIEIETVNNRLSESNKIKEDYLGFFFTEYDNIFEKFNDLTAEIEVNLSLEEYQKASYQLSRYDLKKEKQKLLHNFDTAFIGLFPNFINEFNSLMKPENQIKLKNGQLLNKELRIFALIRLGIKHNDKIAQILGYSVNSIYAYKSKIRNMSKVENELFDQNLIDNTTIKV